MNRALTGSVFLLTALTPLLGCDDVDVGRLTEPEGSPQVVSVFVQDGNRRGGRFITTDILLADKPLVECSYSNPCPAEYGAHDLETDALITCQYTAAELMKPLDDQKGVCNDPLHPAIHPPAIGVAGRGTQIRVVFNKQLNNAIDAVLKADGQTVATLTDSSGAAVATTAYYDNTGVTLRVAFPFAEPAGPAIVIKPKAALFAGETYTLTLDAAQIKDKEGNAATVKPYVFTTEALHPYNGIDPGSLADPLDNEDVISLYLNALADPTPVTTNTAVTLGGTGVFVTVFVNENCDDDGDNSQINIARTSSTGAPLEWVDGEYTYDLTNVVKSAGPMAGKLAGDALGAPFTGTFTVTGTTADSDFGFAAFTLPSQCP